MRVSHPWRWVIAVVAVLIVLIGVYAAWQAHRVASGLSAATDDAARLQQAVEEGDSAGIDRALADLRDHSTAAHDRTEGWLWSLATHLPAYGDDARGVRLASGVVARLSGSGLSSLAASAGQLSTITPSKGRVDVTAVSELQSSVGDAATALASARDDLATQEPSGYVTPLRTRYRDLESRIGQAASTMASVDIATKVLPTMLGGDGPRDYLLVMQNNAEVRSTGGLPGALSLIHADHGRVSMVRQVAGSAIPTRRTSVLPLTKGEKDVYGDQLGSFFLDANETPDFARTSALWRARWEEVEGGHLDGVISVDAVELGYLLQATGPVTVGGIRITPDDAVDVLLHQVYVRIPSPAKQDAFFRTVAKTVFDRVSQGGGSPQSLVRALARGAMEHRVLIHDFTPTVQRQLEGTPVAGGFATTPTTDPQVTYSLNDSTMSKMSYFLRYDVAVRATYCTADVQGLSGSATLTNTLAPDQVSDQTPYVLGDYRGYQVAKGTQVVTMFIHGPVGGTITHVMQDGKPDPSAWTYREGNRPVTIFYAAIGPGQKVDESWQMRTGKGQTGDAVVDVTPGLEPGSSSSTARSACH